MQIPPGLTVATRRCADPGCAAPRGHRSLVTRQAPRPPTAGSARDGPGRPSAEPPWVHHRGTGAGRPDAADRAFGKGDSGDAGSGDRTFSRLERRLALGDRSQLLGPSRPLLVRDGRRRAPCSGQERSTSTATELANAGPRGSSAGWGGGRGAPHPPRRPAELSSGEHGDRRSFRRVASVRGAAQSRRRDGATSRLTANLEARPGVAIGLVSYSVFLWHEPLEHWLRIHGLTVAGPVGLGVNIVVLAAVTGLLSALTYRFVEVPALRHKAPVRRPSEPRAHQPASPAREIPVVQGQEARK